MKYHIFCLYNNKEIFELNTKQSILENKKYNEIECHYYISGITLAVSAFLWAWVKEKKSRSLKS